MWRERFHANDGRVRDLGFDDRFIRMWDFYLATCEAAFRHRQIGVLQLSLGAVSSGVQERSGR
jgi:cyclopropane-fatty-acyl-phospholipid synthase